MERSANGYNNFHKLQLFLQYQLFMSFSSRTKYDYVNAGLIFTPEVFIQCKKNGGLGRGVGDSEFWYTSSKFYSDITYLTFNIF